MSAPSSSKIQSRDRLSLQSINLYQISCFKSVHITFNPGLNVICGVNGLGKSIILASLLQISRPYLNRESVNNTRRSIDYSLLPGVRYGAGSGSINVTFYNGKADFDFIMKLSEEDGPSPDPELKIAYESNSLIEDSRYVYRNMLHFGVDRNFKYRRIAKDGIYGGVMVRRYPIFSTSSLKSWILNTLDEKISSTNNFRVINAETTRRAFSLIGDGYRLYKIEDNEIFIQTPSGVTIFENLSSGYKSALAVLLGIIKLMTSNRVISSEFSGILLIDEIDLHLHPKWQGNFVDALRTIAPKAQIIATTHSPHILQRLKPSELIALKQDSDGGTIVNQLDLNKYGLLGWTIEEILETVMEFEDPRSPQLIEAESKFNQSIDSNDIKQAKKYLLILKDMLHPDNRFRRLYELQYSSINSIARPQDS